MVAVYSMESLLSFVAESIDSLAVVVIRSHLPAPDETSDELV